MMVSRIILLLILHNVNGELIASQVFTRHGQRFPTDFIRFPTEKNTKVNEIYEPGELTETGLNQEYELGFNLKQYYGDFLGNTYRPSQLRVWAGNDNRTITSAQVVLAALFPPRAQQVWNNQLKWQPVPVHTQGILDQVSFGALDYCPSFLHDLVNSTGNVKFMESLKPEILVLQNLTGINITDLNILQKVVDALVSRSDIPDLLPLPSWANASLISFWEGLHHIFHQKFITLMKEPTGGWHFNQIISEFDNTLNQRTKHKFILYSGHDSNMMTLGIYLNISVIKEKLQPVGSYLAFDLSKEGNETVIRVFLHNKLNGSRVHLKIDQCPEPCFYKTFKDLGDPVSTIDFVSACLGEDITVGDDQTVLYGVISSLLIVVTILLGTVMVLLFMSRRTWKKRYHRLAKEERRPLLQQS
ncbi:unnamed protein product [Bursaphelenchus xylophilus]|uniref:(pine wood nematode) hypothetical protein n=1 Tax=Bursaphelenchus xylophilus TaxID=6326 RepID=A0A1I7RQV2_BURXY|nr:unnamed protein product [Bursaphelenchus xylophilus]CAG9130689.1 unnamed protein product [Bursaphelenchus xylophilus]